MNRHLLYSSRTNEFQLAKVPRYTRNREIIYVWTNVRMPPIQADYLECVVYLYTSVEAAEVSGAGGGTGFIVAVKSGMDDHHYCYIVTNSHVIKEGMSPVVRLTTRKGGNEILDLLPSDWTHHPDGDDLAACPIDITLGTHKFAGIMIHNNAVTKEKLDGVNEWITVGNDVFMCGRFKNHEGKYTNTPSARFGNIAMLPQEPIRHERGHDQESYLVEMRSLSGFSGSPVFVYTSKPHLYRDPDTEKVNTVWQHNAFVHFLGVDWCHIHDYERVRDADGSKIPEGWKVKNNSGMAGVIPAWKVIELIDSPKFLMQRKTEDEKRRVKAGRVKNQSPATLDYDSDESVNFTKNEFVLSLQKASQKTPEKGKKDSD
jgi:hypothetical protein